MAQSRVVSEVDELSIETYAISEYVRLADLAAEAFTKFCKPGALPSRLPHALSPSVVVHWHPKWRIHVSYQLNASF